MSSTITIQVNGRAVEAVRDGDTHLIVEVAGRKVRIPVGAKGTLSVPKQGRPTLETAKPERTEAVVDASSAVDEEEDEQAIYEAKRREVREAAKRPWTPKSQRLQVRHKAAKVAAQQHHAAIWDNAYNQAKAEWLRRPLAERFTEADVEPFIEHVMQHVLTNRKLREGYVAAAELAEAVDESPTCTLITPKYRDMPVFDFDSSDSEPDPVVPEPTEPAPVEEDALTGDYEEDVTATTVAAIREDKFQGIDALIDSISQEVGEPVSFTEAAPVVPEPRFVAQRAAQAAPSADPKPAQPRALWLGTMSAGMMSVPVKLHSLHRDEHGVTTFSSHDADGGRIKYVKTCSECGEVVDPADIGRGHKGHDGTVSITAAEVKGLELESLKDITISEFVPAADVDVALFEAHYQVAPGKGGAKAYALLRESLRVESKVAIARIVMRSTERVVAVRVVEDALVMSVLRWADQMRETVDIDAPADFSDTDMDQARALVQAMTTKFVHTDHVDHAQTALVALLDSKI